MPSCQICRRAQADRLVGVCEELDSHDLRSQLRLSKENVKRACGECADNVVKYGKGREIQPVEGDANGIWHDGRYEITDGEHSVSIEEIISVEKEA